MTIKIGDWISFKCDVEQSAKVVEIKRYATGGRSYVVEAPADGFCGNYIGRADFHQVEERDMWTEG